MRWYLWVPILLAVAVAGVLLVRALGRLAEQASEPGPAGLPATGAALRSVRLFFADPDQVGFVTEDRVVPDAPRREDLAASIVAEVLKGPIESALPGLSPATRVRTVYITPDGVGYLDLSSDLLDRWPQGDGLEWAAVGSLVRSLTENLPSLRAVQILVEGRTVEDPPGSLPLDLPLEPEWFEPTPREEVR